MFVRLCLDWGKNVWGLEAGMCKTLREKCEESESV